MRVGKCEERDAGGTVGERDPCSEGDEGREMRGEGRRNDCGRKRSMQ